MAVAGTLLTMFLSVAADVECNASPRVEPTHNDHPMKIKPLVSGLAAVLCLATSASAAISSYLTQTTVTTGQSLKMDWNPEEGWAATIGNHSGDDSLYLTPTELLDFGDEIFANPAVVGSWAGNAFSISTTNSSANGLIDGTFTYSNLTESKPAGNGTYFAGLRYDLGEGNFNYGWVNYSTNADSSEITFLGAAFNTTANEPILAGQTSEVSPVPEPSGQLAIAGLIGSGLLLRRRASRKAVVRA